MNKKKKKEQIAKEYQHGIQYFENVEENIQNKKAEN